MSAAITVTYDSDIERALDRIEALLWGEYHLSRRAVALLLLEGDAEVAQLVADAEGERAEEIARVVATTQAGYARPLSYLFSLQRRRAARDLLQGVVSFPAEPRVGLAERLSQATMNPLTGLPILALVLYLLYQFVGVLGAQTLVNFLEVTVFEAHINPWVDQAVAAIIPWPVWRDLFAGQYGIITLGVRYAIALILPIVGTFFIVFSIIEDSGYLPRLAMLIDRVFKKIGLNGRAVIPMVLGFGCDTMATIVTRTLETRRERVIATMLLALAVPCSAQLGVILAILAGRPGALAVWAIVVTGMFLLVGFLAAQLMPGERPSFYMELPPLRMPGVTNVLVKTYTRMEWYLREVFPVFILASVLIWLGQITGLFEAITRLLVPLVRFLGLPDETAVTFLFGFFRRDYGAAGLYDVSQMLTGAQLAVAAVTLTLFVPCIAQFAVMLKERGPRMALGVVAFIFPFAFLVGGLLSRALMLLGLT